MNPTLIKSHVAGSTVAAFRIVKNGTADGKVVQGTNATVALIGVTGELGADTGERVDVIRSGIAEIEFGGTVARGAPVTADASGKAVAAAPAAGANAYIIGFAEVSAADGDIADVLLAPSVMQGA